MPTLLRLAPPGALLLTSLFATSLLTAPALAIGWQPVERITHNGLEDRTTSGSLAHLDFGLSVVWMQEQPATGWRIMWSDLNELGQWSEPQPVDASGSYPDFGPRVAAGSTGGLDRYLVWQRGASTTSQIMYAQGTVGGLWTIGPIMLNPSEVFTPDIAWQGAPHVVWAGYDPISGTGKVFHAVRGSGGWTIERLAQSELGPFWTGAEPKVAVSFQGIVHVVYRGGDFGNYHAHYARKENGVWSYRILTSGNGNDLIADVAMDGLDPVVAMSGNDGFGFPSRMYIRNSTDGGLTFQVQQLVSGSFSASLSNVTRGPSHGINIVGSEVSGNIYTGNLVIWSQFEAVTELLPPADHGSESPAVENAAGIAAFQGAFSAYSPGYVASAFTHYGANGPDSSEVYVLSTPVTGAVGDMPAPSLGTTLQVTPNPSRGGATITATSGIAPSTLSVYDPLGRLIRTLRPGEGTDAAATYRWDGRSASGTPVAGGVYFLRLDGTTPEAMTRLTIVR